MRKEFEFHYKIYDVPDEEIFYRQCTALENHIPGLTKERLLMDGDGSLYQIYYHEKGELTVNNDFMYGYLYIESDFDIEPYFEQLFTDSKDLLKPFIAVICGKNF